MPAQLIMQDGSRTRQMLVEFTFRELEVWAAALTLIILCQRCGASNSTGQQVCMFRPCSVPVWRDSTHWEERTVTASESQIDCYDGWISQSENSIIVAINHPVIVIQQCYECILFWGHFRRGSTSPLSISRTQGKVADEEGFQSGA